MAELLPRAINRIVRESPDVIVCTGDLLDVPAGPGVVQDLKFCKEVFDDCGFPYLILPGNHDPLPHDFYQVFPKPLRNVKINTSELISFHQDACFDGEQASTRGEQSLREMEELLGRSNGCREVTVLIQHYVIYPDLNNAGYPYNYQNAGAIRAILEQSNRQILSISGHYHPGIPLQQKNCVSYFIGRALCEAPYTCYMIDAARNGFLIEELALGKERQ
jgi:hypothetical protein